MSRAQQLLVPTKGAFQTYIDKLIGIQNGNLVVIWPHAELAGTVAEDVSGQGQNGTYVGPTLNSAIGPDGQPVPLWDGINDRQHVPAGITAPRDFGDEGTLLCWLRTNNAWVGLERFVSILAAAEQPGFYFFQNAGTISVQRRILPAGHRTVTSAAELSADWLCWIAVWSVAGNFLELYRNNVSVGVPAAGLGAFGAGWLGVTTRRSVGSQTTAGNQVTDGWIGPTAIWNTPLGAADRAEASTV